MDLGLTELLDNLAFGRFMQVMIGHGHIVAKGTGFDCLGAHLCLLIWHVGELEGSDVDEVEFRCAIGLGWIGGILQLVLFEAVLQKESLDFGDQLRVEVRWG